MRVTGRYSSAWEAEDEQRVFFLSREHVRELRRQDRLEERASSTKGHQDDGQTAGYTEEDGCAGINIGGGVVAVRILLLVEFLLLLTSVKCLHVLRRDIAESLSHLDVVLGALRGFLIANFSLGLKRG